jgi:non-ribosomal peptide synthetase component F
MTEELKAFARRQQLTLNTVIQGAWALLLSRYSRERDVIFGIVVSGRPTELAGFESMIGLFVNTLPMRATVREEEKIGEWLKGLQREQAEMRQYEYSPLVQVQGWSEVPRGLPLFESYLNFLNYPIDESLRKSGGAVEIRSARSVGTASYPLAVDVMPGSELAVEITYEARRFDRAGVARVLSNLETLLQSFVALPDADLKTLQEILDESDRQMQATREQELQESLRQKMKAVRRRAVVEGH